MAKKKETKKVELKEVSRKEINGAIIITYEDGSVKIIPAPIMLSAEEAKDFFASEEEDDDDEDEEEEGGDGGTEHVDHCADSTLRKLPSTATTRTRVPAASGDSA